VDFQPIDARVPIRGLSGIDFLLMMVPAVAAALALTGEKTTVGIRGQRLARVDLALNDTQLRSYLWVNRKHALASHPGMLIGVVTSAPTLTRPELEAWLKGEASPLAGVSPRGLLSGLQKCRGLLALSLLPQTKQFRLVLVLPT